MSSIAEPEIKSPTPILLVSGFLGAGKTTLLNGILRQRGDSKIAIIVNEFGSIGIDGRLVSAADSMVELAEGCLCCASQGDFGRALADVFRLSQRFDAIIVEASGVANPWAIVEVLEGLEEVLPIRFYGTVTVVDCENFDRNLQVAEVAFGQITAADLLVLTKMDLVDAGTPQLVERSLRRLNDRAAIVSGSASKSISELLASALSLGTGRRAVPAAHDHSHFQSVSLRAPGALSPARFEQWIDSLAPEVLRAKGFLHFEGRLDVVALQMVGARRNYDPASPDVAENELVIIGTDLSPDALRAGFQSCLVQTER